MNALKKTCFRLIIIAFEKNTNKEANKEFIASSAMKWEEYTVVRLLDPSMRVSNCVLGTQKLVLCKFGITA